MRLGAEIVATMLGPNHLGNSVVVCNMGEQGRVRFIVTAHTLASGNEALRTRIEACPDLDASLTTHEVDMIGDTFLRKYFSAFLKLLASMTEDDYNTKLMLFNHVHFTITKQDTGHFELSCHVSLLHDILVELFLDGYHGDPVNDIPELTG
jgi:hypothetical protein